MKQKTQEVIRNNDLYPQSIFTDFSGETTKGIKAGDRAFSFPQIIQLDLTNNCNLNCVGCWCHSELMGKMKFKGEWKKKHLPKESVLKLIKQAAENGTREIQLSGSGDPMMYPHFMEVVREIKNHGLVLHLITNFTLVTKDILERFVELKVDRITVSLWAGTAKTYARTHPNQTEKTFERIKENLLYISNLKNVEKKLPRIRIFNVISNKNYNDIKNMIDFALETNIEFIEFQLVDIVEGKSDSLELNQNQKKIILEQFNKIKEHKNFFTIDSHREKEFTDFGRIYNPTRIPNGFTLEKDGEKMRCPKGYLSLSAQINPITETSLYFTFSQGICLQCDRRSKCYSNTYPFKLNILTILGVSSFIRKLKTRKANNIVDTMPCYIGWTFTRILPNGDVLPCCKGHKKPLGNLHEKSFKDIWYSNTYNKFRYMAKTKKKSHPYFKVINCHKSCDNVGMNLETHMKIKQQ